MTIGIPGGHFFCHLSIPSPSFPASLRHSRLLSVIPAFPLRHSRFSSPSFPARPGIPFKKVQNLSKKEKLSFRKRKISDWVLLKAHIILKFVA